MFITNMYVHQFIVHCLIPGYLHPYKNCLISFFCCVLNLAIMSWKFTLGKMKFKFSIEFKLLCQNYMLGALSFWCLIEPFLKPKNRYKPSLEL